MQKIICIFTNNIRPPSVPRQRLPTSPFQPDAVGRHGYSKKRSPEALESLAVAFRKRLYFYRRVTALMNCRRALDGKTGLIITHRLGAVSLANRILVLEHGKIAQCGTLQELLGEAGLFRTLWDSQTSAYQE